MVGGSLGRARPAVGVAPRTLGTVAERGKPPRTERRRVYHGVRRSSIARWRACLAAALFCGAFAAALGSAAPARADEPEGGSAVPLATPPRANHAPRWEGVLENYTARPGDELRLRLRARDEDGDALTLTAHGLPRDAVAEEVDGELEIRWSPGSADVGTWELRIVASDGAGSAERRLRIVVVEDVESFFLPALAATLYVPNHPETYGAFFGPSFRVNFVSYQHKNEKRGPSHGRFYLDLSLLFSGKSGVGGLFDALLGFELSIERSPSRRFLIPYFGLQGGLRYQPQMDTLGLMEPRAGVELWSTPNFSVALGGGYVLPFVSGFDAIRGPRVTLSASVALW